MPLSMTSAQLEFCLYGSRISNATTLNTAVGAVIIPRTCRLDYTEHKAFHANCHTELDLLAVVKCVITELT